MPQTAVLPLNDGVDMPVGGVVSFRRDSLKDLKETLTTCLEKGLRHFEISDLYGNASSVVDHLLSHEVPREDFYFTMKIWPKFRNKEDVISSFREALEASGLSYVDLLLVHAPIDHENRVEHWKALEAIKQEGLARSIGLAYMTNVQLGDFIKNCTIIPAVLEMEFSPFGQNDEVVEFCVDNGILMLVDEPGVKNMRHSHPVLLEKSEELEISVDEMLLRYAVSKEMGILVNPQLCIDPRFDLRRVQTALPQTAIAHLDVLEEALYSAWDPKEDLGDDIK